jgi:precorrin-2 dehydrogenase/sirohydrochlorin ferrochelatase
MSTPSSDAHGPQSADVSGVPLLVYPGRVRVVCVGGGRVAAGKLAGLMECGADIRVVAPEAVPVLRRAADTGRIMWIPRRYRRDDLGDAHLAIAATSDADVNADVAADADAGGRMCVRVDDARGGSAAFMGAVRRGPLVLGVSTSGAAPGLTRLLRRELEQRYGPEHGGLAALWGDLRTDGRVVDALGTLDDDTRRARWRAIYRSDILGLIRAGKLAEAKEAALACLLSSSD